MHTIHQLEYGLRIWEEFCRFGAYLLTVNARMQQQEPILTGPLVELARFREYVLQTAIPFSRQYDRSRFNLLEHMRIPDLRQRWQGWSEVPDFIWHWNAFSRRNYHLEGDLSLRLAATSLDGVTWRDLLLPFDTFSISLAEPLVLRTVASDPNSERICDLIVVKRQGGDLHFLGFDSRYSGFSAWDPELEQRLQRALDRFRRKGRSRDSHTANSLLQQRTNILSMFVQPAHFCTTYGPKNGLIFSEDGQGAHDPSRYNPLARAVFRMVIGMTLYLQLLAKNGPSGSPPWEPPPPTPDPGAITNGAQICSIRGRRLLDPELREAIIRGFRDGEPIEMCTHFRCGHWRRPPGRGNDPSAPKSVLVDPTLIRADRRVAGSVVGGNQTDVRLDIQFSDHCSTGRFFVLEFVDGSARWRRLLQRFWRIFLIETSINLFHTFRFEIERKCSNIRYERDDGFLKQNLNIPIFLFCIPKLFYTKGIWQNGWVHSPSIKIATIFPSIFRSLLYLDHPFMCNII